jgi:predicted transcriptional regulator
MRRDSGDLERQVLEVLWAAERPLTAGEVNDAVPGDLAYTTVMTVLTRLWRKRILMRRRAGRAYAYVPRLGREESDARRLEEVLDSCSDREAVLSHFVSGLSAPERDRLKREIRRNTK